MFRYIGEAEYNPYVRSSVIYATNRWGDNWMDKLIIADRISFRKYARTISDSFYENGLPIDCIYYNMFHKIAFDKDYMDDFSETDLKCFEQADKIDVKFKFNGVFDFLNDIENEFVPLDEESKKCIKEIAEEEYHLWKFFKK